MTWNQTLKGIKSYRGYKYLSEVDPSDWPADFRDYLLDRLGLETKSSFLLGTAGFFALGLLVGGALGLVFAPMKGTEMRSALRAQGVKGMERGRAVVSPASA